MDSRNYVAHKMLDSKENLSFQKHCQLLVPCVTQLIELQQQVKFLAPFFEASLRASMIMGPIISSSIYLYIQS